MIKNENKEPKPFYDHELDNKICYDCEQYCTQHETDEGGLCHFCYHERYLLNSPSFDKDIERYENDGIWNLEIPLYVWKIIQRENKKRFEELTCHSRN